MDRREALKEGVRNLGNLAPLVLGAVAGLAEVLRLAGHGLRPETRNPLTVKRKKKPVRRDPE